jgi:rare lipoprotein A
LGGTGFVDLAREAQDRQLHPGRPGLVEVLGFAGKIYEPSAAQKRDHAPAPQVELSDFGVQVGAFRRYEGALSYQRKYQAMVDRPERVIIRKFMVDGAPLYRVWVMGFRSADEARDFIAEHGLAGAFLVRR